MTASLDPLERQYDHTFGPPLAGLLATEEIPPSYIYIYNAATDTFDKVMLDDLAHE